MKRFFLALLLSATPVLAQNTELQAEAVKAFQAGDYPTAKSLFESILALDPKNAAAPNYLRLIAAKEKGGGTGMEPALRKLLIPKVNFQDATVRESVAFVTQKVRELSDGKLVMNVVWLVPADDPSRITLSLQNVPAAEVLRYIAESANLRVDYDEHAVTIRPRAQSVTSAP